METFDLQTFRDVIATTEPHCERLAGHSFPTSDFDGIADDVAAVYDKCKAVAERTGASKILHFRHPRLFVMWDTDLRKNYGFTSA